MAGITKSVSPVEAVSPEIMAQARGGQGEKSRHGGSRGKQNRPKPFLHRSLQGLFHESPFFSAKLHHV